MKFFIIFLLYLYASTLYAYNLSSVSSISSAGSNISLVLNHEAFVINPAFLHLSKLVISNQVLDTTNIYTKKNNLSYLIYNGLGIGTMTKETDTTMFDVGLIGYGTVINKNFSWGITYQTITMKKNNLFTNSWSSLFGVSYADFKNNIYVGMTLEHFLKDHNQEFDKDIYPTMAIGFNTIPWDQIMWSHKFSYVRKENESIKYSSGISILANENIVFNFGLNDFSYNLGFDIPFEFKPNAYLGSGRFALEIPYDTSQEIMYSISYTWGK
jgi:hypothetical protein